MDKTNETKILLKCDDLCPFFKESYNVAACLNPEGINECGFTSIIMVRKGEFFPRTCPLVTRSKILP